MSLSALLAATREHLRDQVPLTDRQCDVEIDAQPPPNVGDLYVAVHPTGWGLGDAQPDYGLDEVYRITCTVMRRLTPSPEDRIDSEIFLKALTGLEAIARKVMLAIHQNYDLMNAANALMTGPDKLVQPLFWDGCDVPPRTETGAWLWSDEPSVMNLKAALVLPVRFREARRVQAFSTME